MEVPLAVPLVVPLADPLAGRAGPSSASLVDPLAYLVPYHPVGQGGHPFLEVEDRPCRLADILVHRAGGRTAFGEALAAVDVVVAVAVVEVDRQPSNLVGVVRLMASEEEDHHVQHLVEEQWQLVEFRRPGYHSSLRL